MTDGGPTYHGEGEGGDIGACGTTTIGGCDGGGQMMGAGMGDRDRDRNGRDRKLSVKKGSLRRRRAAQRLHLMLELRL